MWILEQSAYGNDEGDKEINDIRFSMVINNMDSRSNNCERKQAAWMEPNHVKNKINDKTI